MFTRTWESHSACTYCIHLLLSWLRAQVNTKKLTRVSLTGSQTRIWLSHSRLYPHTHPHIHITGNALAFYGTYSCVLATSAVGLGRVQLPRQGNQEEEEQVEEEEEGRRRRGRKKSTATRERKKGEEKLLFRLRGASNPGWT